MYLLNNIAILVVDILAFAIPIGAVVYYKKRTKIKLWPFLCGALMFLAFAMGLEQILHYFCVNPNTQIGQTILGNPVLYTLYAGFAAGIFEETGRLFGFKVCLKNYEQKETALAYGIGHGGVEVLCVLGVTYLLYILAIVGVDFGDDGLLLQTAKSMPLWMFPVSVLERLSAMVIHIGLSMIVFVGARRNVGYYFLAILLHALVDFPAALYQKGLFGIGIVEVITLALAILYAYIGWKLLKKLDAPAQEVGVEGDLPEKENSETI